MRLIVTESQYNLLMEQGFEFPKTGNPKWDNPENFYAKQDVFTPQLDKKRAETELFIKMLESNRPQLDNALKQAQQWWRNWLNNSTTRAKFQKLHNYYPDKVENIFRKYFDRINNLKLIFFYEDSGIFGKVMSNEPDKIFLNAKYYNRPIDSWLLTIIHEIQHLLFWIHPLTPDSNITQFKSSDDCYRKNNEIYRDTQLSYEDKIKTLTKNNITKISQDLNIYEKYVPYHITPFLQKAYGGWKEGYLRNDPSELGSRIAATRFFFLGDKANTDINLTKKHFVDYIVNYKNKGSEKSEQVDYVLCHWVMRDFESLAQFVDYLNTKFVKVDPQTNSKEGIASINPTQQSNINKI